MSNHFIVLQHGSHGKADHLNYLRVHLNAVLPTGSAIVWDTKVNEKRNTDGGLLVCADRLWAELRPALVSFVDEYNANGGHGSGKPPKFSAIGHSFGGLILREIVYRIASDPKLVKSLEFHSFVTLATPHLGVSDMPDFMKFGALFIGKRRSVTYLELLLETDILYNRLIDAEHIAALARFQQRLLYASTYDHLVTFNSGTLSFTMLEKDILSSKDRLAPVDGIHPHVLCERPLEEDSPEGKLVSKLSPRALEIRAALLQAGSYRIFPVHFNCGRLLSHANIIGLGPLYGKYSQDISHHVAVSIRGGSWNASMDPTLDKPSYVEQQRRLEEDLLSMSRTNSTLTEEQVQLDEKALENEMEADLTNEP